MYHLVTSNIRYTSAHWTHLAYIYTHLVADVTVDAPMYGRWCDFVWDMIWWDVFDMCCGCGRWCGFIWEMMCDDVTLYERWCDIWEMTCDNMYKIYVAAVVMMCLYMRDDVTYTLRLWWWCDLIWVLRCGCGDDVTLYERWCEMMWLYMRDDVWWYV